MVQTYKETDVTLTLRTKKSFLWAFSILFQPTPVPLFSEIVEAVPIFIEVLLSERNEEVLRYASWNLVYIFEHQGKLSYRSYQRLY